MRTACFVRVLQRCTGRLYMNFLSIFQAIRAIGKTRNQLTLIAPAKILKQPCVTVVFQVPFVA